MAQKDIQVNLTPSKLLHRTVRSQTKPKDRKVINPLQQEIATHKARLTTPPVSKAETGRRQSSIQVIPAEPPSNMHQQPKQQNDQPQGGQVWIERQFTKGKPSKTVRVLANVGNLVTFCSEEGLQKGAHSNVYVMEAAAFIAKWRNARA